MKTRKIALLRFTALFYLWPCCLQRVFFYAKVSAFRAGQRTSGRKNWTVCLCNYELLQEKIKLIS